MEVDCGGCVAPCCRGFSMGVYGRAVGLEGFVASPAHAAVLMAEGWEEQSRGLASVRLGEPDLHPVTFETDDPSAFNGLEPPRLRCTAIREDSRCGVYEDRPWACRVYDCRTDPLRTLAGEAPRCDLRA